MGDRAAFGFRAEADGPTIYLYSHWGGSTQAADLAAALEAARPRWNDPSYATRIAVSAIVGGDWSSETGYGLSATADGRVPFGIDYPYAYVVDWSSGRVLRVGEGVDDLHGWTLIAEFASAPYLIAPEELADLVG